MLRPRVSFPRRPLHSIVLLCLAPALLSSCASQDEFPTTFSTPFPTTAPAATPERPVNSHALPIVPPDPADAEVPHGFRVEVVISHLTYPTSVEFDDEQNLYIAEAGAAPGGSPAPARILRVSPSGQIDVMTDKLSPPVNDLLFHDGKLYVAQRGRICIIDPEGGVRDIATGPLLEGQDHNQLAIGSDGNIWVTQGSPSALPLLTTRPQSTPPSTQSAVPAPSGGALLTMSPDGSQLLIIKEFAVAPFGLTRGPGGVLLASFNRLGIAPDAPPDVIQSVEPPPPTPPQSPEQRVFVPGRAGVAKMTFLPPNATAFGPPTMLYFTEFGSAPLEEAPPQDLARRSSSEDVGGMVCRVDLSSSNPMREPFLIARTTESAPAELDYRSPAGPRRPIDVRFAPDGSAIYVVDFGLIRQTEHGLRAVPETGVIWRITPRNAPLPPYPANLSPPPERLPPLPK